MKTFEDYLQSIFLKQESPLDDNISDEFDKWLENQDVNDIVEYGELFFKELQK